MVGKANCPEGDFGVQIPIESSKQNLIVYFLKNTVQALFPVVKS